MHRVRLSTQRLAALFLFGCVLFNYPLLSLFNHDGEFFGLPPLFAWLMGGWLLLIVLMAWTVERTQD
jgi:hypothetical protein